MAEFTENDIRPSEFEEAKLKAHAEDLAFYLSKKSEFVEVVCPACGANHKIFEFEKYDCEFHKCQNCHMVYMTPRPTAEFLGEFYSSSKLYSFWNKYIFPASEKVRREKIFKPRVDRILEIADKYNITKDTLIEAGAGFGIFCDEVNKTGQFKQVIAIEPGTSLAENCRQLGVDTLESPVEQVDPAKYQADIIASFEVIEHLFNPREFLNSCHKLLKPQGLIALSCPNWEGFDIQILGAKSDSLDNEHINMFTPSSLQLLLKECGFNLIESLTPGELDSVIVRNQALAGEIDFEGQPFLKKVLIEDFDTHGDAFQQFLKDQKLSSHLWVIAQKSE